MAHKKGQGSSRNGRDSNPQYLGVKRFGGETVTGGSILVRQRGTRFFPGVNVGIGKDDTLYAKIAGVVQFRNRGRRGTFINILTTANVGNAADAADTADIATTPTTPNTAEVTAE